jgi:hypothetical protein
MGDERFGKVFPVARLARIETTSGTTPRSPPPTSPASRGCGLKLHRRAADDGVAPLDNLLRFNEAAARMPRKNSIGQ